MRLLFKAVLAVAVLAVLELVGFAIFSDLPAPERDIAIPVEAR